MTAGLVPSRGLSKWSASICPADKFLSTLRQFLSGGGEGGSTSSSSSPPQCQRCGRLYSTRGNLRRHREYECGVEPRFSCSGCGRKFTHKHHMSSHVHSGRCSGAPTATWTGQKPAWRAGAGAPPAETSGAT